MGLDGSDPTLRPQVSLSYDDTFSDNQGSDTRRGTGIAILKIVGQCGPLLGTNIFPKGESPRDHKGMWVSAASTLFIGFLALCLRTLLVWKNKKLDEKYGPIADLHAAEGINLPMQKTAVGEEYSGSRSQTVRSRRGQFPHCAPSGST
ncbi:MAG: hypothetical protein L6R35_005515 [Caloplaca aegaea]|nr:MAG: hypothetical protein L6R35_005515 [Caloplaca aegaea]